MSYLREDLKRYFIGDQGIFSKVKTVLLTQGICATVVYRAGSWCYNRKGRYIWVRAVLPFLTVVQKITEIVSGIALPFSLEVGKALYIGHFGGIIISPHAVLGEYCNISQGCTTGQAGRGGKERTPIIGSRVYIAPGAKIFGGIKIGNDVAIGANAVVTKDLPDKPVAVGIPAQIISYNGSSDFVLI